MNIVKKLTPLFCVLVTALTVFAGATQVKAVDYQNPDTGYVVDVYDEAGLLSSSEIDQLIEDMKPITEYGDVLFASIIYNSTSTAYYAESYLRSKVSMGESGVLFLIDMYHRNLYIYSDGELYSKLGTSYADSITDNVYRKATNGDYYDCASTAYSQIYRVMKGQWISQPMKYICNALVAILIAMIICFIIVNVNSKLKNPTDAELLKTARMRFELANVTEEKTHTTKKYSPRSSGSGGHSGGGGGGGGGGHSGGGGGHGF